MCDGLVIAERGVVHGEELAPLARLLHVFYDLRNENFVFFFRILLIEDAVVLFPQTAATKEI